MSDLRPERLHLQDANSQHISICGKSFVADASGALYWPSERALIVADLSLENEAFYSACGAPIPAANPKDTLVTLAKTVDHYGARTVIALGIDIRNHGSAQTIDDEIIQILKIMQENCEWIWIEHELPGNASSHSMNHADTVLGGAILNKLTVGEITLRHRPTDHRITHEISGGLKPAARMSTYGHIMRRPCFIGNGKRLILPAFGSFTGGRNILDDVFRPLFGQDGILVWMMGQDGVYPISTRRLVTD